MNADSLSPELRGRLEHIQHELRARGVSLKLARSPGAHSSLELAEDLASGLEAYLEGRCHPLPPFGDSVADREVEHAQEEPLHIGLIFGSPQLSLERPSDEDDLAVPL